MDTKTKKIVLFDGVCNLCNASVNFIIDHDSAKEIFFASLQSEAGRKIVAQAGLPPDELTSMVFVDGEKVYVRSTGILKISKYLSGIWKLGIVFLVIPRFIRDAVYDFVARHRYRWFGKREACRLPTPELKSRFLE